MSHYPYDHPSDYDAIFAEQAEDAARFLLGMLRPGSRVISLGCGSGIVESRLAEAGHEVIGIDLSLPMLRAGQGRSDRVTWLNGRIEAMPVEGARADAIISPLLSSAYLTTEDEQRAVAHWIKRNIAPTGFVALELTLAWTPMRVQGIEEATPDRDFSFRFLDAEGASPWAVRVHTELRVGELSRRAPLAVYSPGGVRALLGREARLSNFRFMAPWDAETLIDHPPHNCLRAVVIAESSRHGA